MPNSNPNVMKSASRLGLYIISWFVIIAIILMVIVHNFIYINISLL